MVQAWYDNTGLYRKFGPDKATSLVVGEPVMTGDIHELNATITLSGLTQSETPLSDVVQIPAGAFIKSLEVFTEVAAATGTAIDLGFIKTDRSTEIDYNGLLAAFPTASMNAVGETNLVEVGHTYAGALLGTAMAYTGYLTCSMTDATSFTAGKIRVRVRYYMP